MEKVVDEKTLDVSILTPAEALFQGQATEVVLPAYDGEVGILPGHSDFIGVLGTGPLKIVRGGDDYWFMVSSGVYSVKNGVLSVLSEQGEKPKSGSEIETIREELAAVEEKLANVNSYTVDEFPSLVARQAKLRAQIDVHRRTEILN